MTRNVRTMAKHPEMRPVRVSILVMWVVIAINLAGLVPSLLML